MEDRIQRARLRFQSMLASAQEAADRAALDPPVSLGPSTSTVAAIKAMNRAGGFLEAVSIVLPELGAELLGEFETFALRVNSQPEAIPAEEDRRVTPARRARGDRRGWDRRLGRDRRRQAVEVAVDLRQLAERRTLADRRTGELRELADRRLRALHR